MSVRPTPRSAFAPSRRPRLVPLTTTSRAMKPSCDT
jgi:hypothetical protein